jgi:serine/threonine protein kinase
MAARLCPECGKQYISKSRFCRDDGARLVDQPSQPEPATAPEPEPKPKPAKGSARDAKSKPGLKGEAKAKAEGKGERLDSPTPMPLPGTDPRPSVKGKAPLRATGSGGTPRPSGVGASAKPRVSGEGRKDKARRDAKNKDSMLGRVIAGRFLLEAVIGAGATGVVYRATHRALGRTMAVKLLKPQFIWDERSLQRFLREARTCSLLDHPNIVYLYDFGRDDRGEPFLVMELAEGETLHSAIQGSPSMTLTVERVVAIMLQVARALEHAHSRGVVHRDIKPENIVLTTHDSQPDWVKILDFGVARIVGQAPVTGHGQVTGTAEFIAPETLIGDGIVAPPGDLYAVGIIFHDALVGRPPFTGTLDVVLHQHLEVVPPLLSERSADPAITPELDDLVSRLLDKDPAKRPTATQLAVELEEIQLAAWLVESETSASAGDKVSAQSTQPIKVSDRRTSVFPARERKTELHDRLGRPTQVVARPNWPTRLSGVVQGDGKPLVAERPQRSQTSEELIKDAERQTSFLHVAAVTLAAQLWPGGWPQALLNLLQHIESCDQQERHLQTALTAHEDRARHQDEVQRQHQTLRQEILALSERLRIESKLDDKERARLYADLEGLERAFFASDQSWAIVPGGVLDSLRQRLVDVSATRRRSRILFARLLIAMPCPPPFEDERRQVAQLLASVESRSG